VWYDISSKKHKSFSDVARLLEESEYRWLANDVAETSFTKSSSRPTKGTSCHREDPSTYKNVRLSTVDPIRDEEGALEDSLDDVSNEQGNTNDRHPNLS
jgi:hypothetical protein